MAYAEQALDVSKLIENRVPPRRKIMSAKWTFALLVIVALSLMLFTGSAVSRSEMSPRDAGTALGYVTHDDGDGPDDFEPGDGAIGDDDNWDKPLPDVHGTMDAGARVVDGWNGETPDARYHRGRQTIVIWVDLIFRSLALSFSMR